MVLTAWALSATVAYALVWRRLRTIRRALDVVRMQVEAARPTPFGRRQAKQAVALNVGKLVRSLESR